MKRTVMKFLSALVTLFVLSIPSYSQSSENIVILWDVTGSLLPQKQGAKDFNGSPIPAYSQGNGMWKSLKDAVIDCIEYAEEDPENEISIITFNDEIRDIITRNASDKGKEELVTFVKDYQYKGHKYTNIVAAIEKFYDLLGENKINYMFLFTDGDNDAPNTKSKFISTLDDWTRRTSSNNAFGFYVIVHPDADKPEIRATVEPQDNFWIVPDAKVRIKICSFPTSIKYNIRDDKGPLVVGMNGKYAGASGYVKLSSTDKYYDVICQNTAIKNGRLAIDVRPKAGIVPPDNHTINLIPDISGADNYTFVGPKDIKLEITNLPERNLNLIIKNKDIGDASYYGSFLISKENNTPAVSNIGISFSEQAVEEGSSAAMKIYFVDKKGKKCIQDFKICVNGNELKGDTFMLTPEMTEITLSIIGLPDTKGGKYYGRIELIPSNLDNCSINGDSGIFKWKIDFKQKWNPIKLTLTLLVLLLIAASLLWMIVLKPMLYPRFGSVQKTFIVSGMAPLVVKFKGARAVVVSATPQKKQSGLNKFWTGKILYKIHPAFTIPIIFKPSRGRRILARVQPGSYQVWPNPISEVGTAKIVDIKKNITISVN